MHALKQYKKDWIGKSRILCFSARLPAANNGCNSAWPHFSCQEPEADTGRWRQETWVYNPKYLLFRCWEAVTKSALFFIIFQSEEEGKPVIGVYSNFDPTPDAQTLYKAMKGLGELTPATCVNSMLCLWFLRWMPFIKGIVDGWHILCGKILN